MKKLITTEEAARILGVTPRAIQKKFNKGKIEGQLVDSHKGYGKSGQVLMVWVEELKESSELEVRSSEKEINPDRSACTNLRRQGSGDHEASADRYRVNRGEPGCRVVTSLVNGVPVIDEEAQSSKLKVQSQIQNLPAVLRQVQDDTKRVPERYNRIGNLKFALIQKFNEELGKEDPNLPLFKNGNGNGRHSKTKKIQGLLDLYNAGILLPEIYGELKSISRATLYNWFAAADQDGVNGLIPQHGRAGVSKISEHEKNLILTLLLHQNRLKTAYAITLAKNYLAKKRIESPSSPATLRRFVDQFKSEHYDIWVLRREGEKAHNDKVMPYAERDPNLLEVGEGLVADGHRLNFQVIHPITGKPCRAALVLFWDWRSSYPLGWEIMVEENIQCVASALRNAILTLGKIPKWIYLDNGKAFKAKIFTEDIDFEDGELPGMFARLNINYHFAQPYNAQSKPIERIFGILNEQLERLLPSYTGASIEDKPAWTKRNEKLARAAHNPYVPTIQETNDLITAWRDRYAENPSRGRDGLRPINIYNDGKGPGVDPNGLTYLMMDREIKTIHRNGVTWLGWHWYDEALYGLKDKVVIRYSLADLSQIYIFHKNEFLCTARPVEKVNPMASESESPKDMEAVKEVIRLKKRVKNTTRKLSDLLETKAASQIDWSRTKTPQIAETIQKIEEKKKPKVVNISPFLEEAESSKVKAEREENPNGRPWFFDDYEKYDWLMKQESISPEDRIWMEEFISKSSLYKHAANR